MKWVIQIIVAVNIMYSSMALSDYVSGQYGDNAGTIDFYFDGDLRVNIYTQDRKITTTYSVKNGSLKIGFLKTLFDLNVKDDGDKLANKNNSGILNRLSPQIVDDYNRYAGVAAGLAEYYCLNSIDSFEKLKSRLESDKKIIKLEGKVGAYKYQYKGVAYVITIDAESSLCTVEADLLAGKHNALFKVGNVDLILSDRYEEIKNEKNEKKYFTIEEDSEIDGTEKSYFLFKEYKKSKTSDAFMALFYPVDLKNKSVFYIDVYKK